MYSKHTNSESESFLKHKPKEYKKPGPPVDFKTRYEAIVRDATSDEHGKQQKTIDFSELNFAGK